MKKLILVRHGNAPYVDSSDFDRKLSEQGMKEIEQTSNFLENNFEDIHLILSSTAPRSVESADVIFKNFKLSKREKSEIIYKGKNLEIRDYISQFSSQDEIICIVGHNPSISEIANHLLESINKSSEVIYFQTGQAVYFNFDIQTWDEILYKKPVSCVVFIP